MAGRSGLDKIDFLKITIIGLGLMGGSLAMALKRYGFQGEIVGVGRRVENLEKAQNRGIIDRYWTDPAKSVKDADLVVLASHVGSFIGLTSSFKDILKKGSILTDLGSVKANLVQELEAIVPDSVNYVGAHPIAGSERSGVEAAHEELYKGQTCIITPTSLTDKNALQKVMRLWEFVGAKPVIMDSFEHDRLFGAISHLPHIAAYALVNTVVDFEPESLSYSGRGFKDTTRIALSPAELWIDICQYNKNNVIELLGLFEVHLTSIKKKLNESDWDGLKKEFLRARKERQKIDCKPDYN